MSKWLLDFRDSQHCCNKTIIQLHAEYAAVLLQSWRMLQTGERLECFYTCDWSVNPSLLLPLVERVTSINPINAEQRSFIFVTFCHGWRCKFIRVIILVPYRKWTGVKLFNLNRNFRFRGEKLCQIFKTSSQLHSCNKSHYEYCTKLVLTLTLKHHITLTQHENRAYTLTICR